MQAQRLRKQTKGRRGIPRRPRTPSKRPPTARRSVLRPVRHTTPGCTSGVAPRLPSTPPRKRRAPAPNAEEGGGVAAAASLHPLPHLPDHPKHLPPRRRKTAGVRATARPQQLAVDAIHLRGSPMSARRLRPQTTPGRRWSHPGASSPAPQPPPRDVCMPRSAAVVH